MGLTRPKPSPVGVKKKAHNLWGEYPSTKLTSSHPANNIVLSIIVVDTAPWDPQRQQHGRRSCTFWGFWWGPFILL
ncbi:hypothetical protein GBA52_008069 [Prunus armeniaca]|nr:hypothetical protein GBA52_008069 [Prunus armeniaca]